MAAAVPVAAMAAMPALPGGGISDLFTNRVFLAGFWGWFTAQALKVRVRGGAATATAAERAAAAEAACVLQSSAINATAVLPSPLHCLCVSRPVQIFTKRLKKGVWDVRAIVDSGGMPSSHSALCAVRRCSPPPLSS